VTAPAIVIEIPVEGRAHAWLRCGSYEEELRLMLDLEHRQLPAEIREALDHLFDVLGDLQEDA
jgi:hypothetical protein